MGPRALAGSMPRGKTVLWVALGLALAAAVLVGAYLAQAPASSGSSPAPAAPTHEGGMSPDEMCQHMPEHCGNRTAPG